MIPAERKDKILSLLNQHGFLSTKDLSNELYVSDSTIRRDLVELEEARLIIKSHGGATLTRKLRNEITHELRENINQDEKVAIADVASTFIIEGYSIFLDSSTTVNAIVPFVKSFRDLVIITNGVKTALDLSNYKDIKVILVGGELLPNSSSVIGTSAYNSISKYKVDLCFISCRGLDENFAYEANEEQANIKHMMLTNSKQKILLSDSSKFNNKDYFYKLYNLEEFDYVITNSIDSHNDIQQSIRRKGIKIITS